MNKRKLMIFLGVFCTLTFLITIPTSLTSANTEKFVDAVVLLNDGISIDLGDVDLSFVYEELNGFAGRMPVTLYNALANSPLVSSIQLDREVTICEDTLDWGVDDTDAEEVWGGAENAVNVLAGRISGAGVKVAVIDTGIDYNHPDLNDNYVGGYDFVNNDAYPMDDHSHGTHCAGIIAAEDNGAGVIGVAPEASLYGVKVLNSAGSGTIGQIVAGIDWCVDNNMDVGSMSLRSTSSDPAMEDACSRAHAAGVIIVAATGNDYGAIGYPARYSTTIAVGAIDSSRTRASFSNYGSDIDVVAPGVNIYSTVLSGSYGTKSGTSMACPMVSGLCALILEANPSLGVEDVRNILHTTSDDLGATGFDIYYGYGTIDCVAAVDAAGGGSDTTPPSVTITSPNNGDTVSGTVTITASASDNVGVDYVQCRVDGGAWNDDTTSPYSWTWDTTGYADGSSHTIDCRAYDAAGNYADDSITVTVDNSVTPTDTWGITSSSFTSASSHSNIRIMGGTSPSTTMTVTKLHIRCGSSGTVAIALYTGGTLSDPTGATRRTEAHNIAVSAGWNEIDVPDYSVSAGTTTWIAWAHSCSVYYSSSSADAGDFQSARGRWNVNSPSDYDQTSALPTTIGAGSFNNYWYAVYAEYTTEVIPDTTPPTVEITSPSNGASVSGTITITADATDNVGVDYVQCRVNSGSWVDDTTSPYSWTLDTTSYADGTTLTIDCRAYDAAGNYADDSITVTVDNSVTPTDGEWGITSSSFSSSSTHSVIRYMGGTTPDYELTVTHLYIRCASSGTVSIALYTGGSLTNPTSAIRRTEAHNVAVSAGWNAINVPDYVIPANTITWIGWAHNCRVYYSYYSSNAGDFQTARGRWSQYSPSDYDQTTALPTNPGSGSFSNYWYAVYAKYTAIITAASNITEIPVPLEYIFVCDIQKI